MSTKKNKSVPVADANFAHVLPGPSNEELVRLQEEVNRKRAELGFPKVEFGADAADKQMDGFGDLDYDPLGLTDPLAQLKKDYQRPGMALKLLSPDVMNRLGKRGYQIVKDENGDPVHMGKMVLGETSERRAEQRRQAVIAKTKEEVSAITDSHREAIEKLKSQGRDMGLTVLEDGDRVKNVGDGATYDMGMTIERGENPASA